MAAQQRQIEEMDVMAGEEETPRAGKVNEGGGGGGKGAMPELDKLAAAAISLPGMSEDFFGLHVEEAHAHGSIAKYAFKVADAAAAAVAFLRIETDDDVTSFPHAFNVRPAAITDTVADRPDLHQLVQLAAGGGHAGGDGIGIIRGVDRGGDAALDQRAGEIVLETHAFDLGKVGRVFNHALAHDAGDSDPDGFNRTTGCGKRRDETGKNFHKFAGRDRAKVFGFG